MQAPQQPMRGPVFYPIPNMQPGLDNSAVSTDSGMGDGSMYVYQGYPQPQPITYMPYYAPPPMPQTPQIVQMAAPFVDQYKPPYQQTTSGGQTPIATVAPLQAAASQTDVEDNTAAEENV